MYYQDLSFYRTGGRNGTFEVYPYAKNIGWLGREEAYSRGQLPGELVQKLKELVYLDVKNQDDMKASTFNKSEAVIVD